MLKNRINKLQNQEFDINKEFHKLQKKYVNEEKIKHEKLEKKTEYENIKIESARRIEEKKKRVEIENLKRKDLMDKLIKQNIVKNKVNYYF